MCRLIGAPPRPVKRFFYHYLKFPLCDLCGPCKNYFIIISRPFIALSERLYLLHNRKRRIDLFAVPEGGKPNCKKPSVQRFTVTLTVVARSIGSAPGPMRCAWRTGLLMFRCVYDGFQDLFTAAGIRKHGGEFLTLRMSGVTPAHTVEAFGIRALSYFQPADSCRIFATRA